MTVITKEYLKQELDQFNDQQLKQVADFIAFSQETVDISQFANLYQEFAQEDRELAEAGISDYAELLNSEDKNESGAW
jgi:hypothetical protein